MKELRKLLLRESRNEVGDVKSNNRHEVRHQHQHGVTGGADAAHAGGEEHEAKQRDFSSVHSLGELGPLGDRICFLETERVGYICESI